MLFDNITNEHLQVAGLCWLLVSVFLIATFLR